MSGDKELGLYRIYVANNSIEDQLNRFLALHALVEGLGICWAMSGLKFPILLNWVKLRPGIWDGGAISSTDWGVTCDRAPTWGCLGLAPSKGSKQCGMDILPIFLLRFGSSLLMWDGFFGLPGDLRGILIYNAKVWDGGQWVVEIFTMFKYGWGCWLGLFLDPFTKGPRSFPNVGWVTPICLAFPVVD